MGLCAVVAVATTVGMMMPGLVVAVPILLDRVKNAV